MIGRLLFFWEGLFSGAILVSSEIFMDHKSQDSKRDPYNGVLKSTHCCIFSLLPSIAMLFYVSNGPVDLTQQMLGAPVAVHSLLLKYAKTKSALTGERASTRMPWASVPLAAICSSWSRWKLFERSTWVFLLRVSSVGAGSMGTTGACVFAPKC